VEYGGWQFRVILVDNKMIKTVKAVKISEDAAEHAAAHE
jgi:hypothetical protein